MLFVKAKYSKFWVIWFWASPLKHLFNKNCESISVLSDYETITFEYGKIFILVEEDV